MGFKVVKSKQLRELPLLEVKVELPSIDGGTTLPPEDEILYEILPRLNREEATQKRAQKLAPKPGWESYQPIQQ